jgi:hypothetical protein
MLPCNSDEEIDDSWIHTSHNQFKHEKTGLCIGKFATNFTKLSVYSFLFFPPPDRKNLDKNYVHAASCDSNSKTQKWEFQKSDRNSET